MALCTCKTLISLFDTVSPTKPPLPISNSISAVSSSSSKTSKPLISTHDHLTNHHQFSQEAVLEASSSTPYLHNPQNFDSLVSFLMENGFSKSHIEEILKKRPDIFSSKIITIKPRLQNFQDLGVAQVDIADLVTRNPWLLHKNIATSISVLKGVLGSNAKVFRALKKSIDLARYDLEKTMVPNIDFLKSCDICSSRIEKFVFINPLVLTTRPELLRETVERVDALGVSRESKMYLYIVHALNALPSEKWEKKVQVFRSLGLSDEQILCALRRAPLAFTRSDSKIKETCQILFRRKSIDASFIAQHPELLNLSVENRIKPRLMVYDILERENLCNTKQKLVPFLKLSQKVFVSRYVVPYSEELGDDVARLFKTSRPSSS